MPYGEARQATVQTSEWDKRVRRAAELAERYTFANEILDFYGRVLTLQQAVVEEIGARAVASAAEEASLRSRLNVSNVSRHLPALFSLAEKHGPAKLAEEAGVVARLSQEEREDLLRNFLTGESTAHAFFARALLQPYAEKLAANLPQPPPAGDRFACPICGSRPQTAVLRPEGDGGKRFLLCSLCLTEWEFRRILCAACGEENYQKLPRYCAEDVAAVRVEACDTCHFYLKSIDLTVDGLAVPLVDEVAAVPLDLWAAEHGYKKIEPNLMGF